MNRTHPLSINQEWLFAQYDVGLQAPIWVDPISGRGKGHQKIISATSSCREGLVNGIRRKLFHSLGGAPYGNYYPNYEDQELTKRLVLDRDSLRRPGASFLSVDRGHLTLQRVKPHPKAGQPIPQPSYWREEYGRWRGGKYPTYRYDCQQRLTQKMVQEFITFCDAIIGPLTVLLNPSRFEGNWWQTSVEEAMTKAGYLRWYGIDNSALAHPALVSLYSGLARQCAILARCGLQDQVLAGLDLQELRECLNNSDPDLAFRLVRRMRKWLEVPPYKHGSSNNIPVPVGSFPKIPALHKAIYKHGFATTFGKSLEAGWALTARDPGYSYNDDGITRYRGIHSFMGLRGANSNGKRIQKLAQKAPSQTEKSE